MKTVCVKINLIIEVPVDETWSETKVIDRIEEVAKEVVQEQNKYETLYFTWDEVDPDTLDDMVIESEEF